MPLEVYSPLRGIVDYQPVATGSFETWRPFEITPQLLAIGVTTLIIVAISIYFFVSARRCKANESLTGLALLLEMGVASMRNLVADTLGVRFVKLTPYFLYLFAYIAIGNLISVIGFESQTTSYTVPLSMGLVTFVGTFVFGLKYQRSAFLRSFTLSVKIKGQRIPVFLNPSNVIEPFTRLISLTFRLWGNITAGAIILTMFYGLTAYIVGYIPVIGAFNFLGSAIAPALHAFFDLLEGTIQAFVFCVLTMVYWGRAVAGEETAEVEKIETQLAAQRTAEQPQAVQAAARA